jgi:hypothetical protein
MQTARGGDPTLPRAELDLRTEEYKAIDSDKPLVHLLLLATLPRVRPTVPEKTAPPRTSRLQNADAGLKLW